ncbi:MAG: carbamoyl phosphate synthase large subunit, partial [Gammaproteobacteria bacterium]|nr:carbamoyl phosphate synthase large subunit [Gammaproteobacteria bacterium]
SVRERDHIPAIEVGKQLVEQNFELVATRGTATILRQNGVECQIVNKVYEGRPHIVDMIKNDDIDLIINTTEGKKAIADSYTIRAAALQHKVSYTTTLAGARATCMALQYQSENEVNRLQDLHQEI